MAKQKIKEITGTSTVFGKKESVVFYEINGYLVQDKIITEPFLCDLSKCKGHCCTPDVDNGIDSDLRDMIQTGTGDLGSFIQKEEVPKIKRIVKHTQHLLTPKANEMIKKDGLLKKRDNRDILQYEKNYGCVFAYQDNNIEGSPFLCALESCYLNGTTKFRKPMSCWLYPVFEKMEFKFSETGMSFIRYLYYWKIKECNSAIENGIKNNVKLYQALKEPLIKKLGKSGYNKLEKLAEFLTEK